MAQKQTHWQRADYECRTNNMALRLRSAAFSVKVWLRRRAPRRRRLAAGRRRRVRCASEQHSSKR
jgi:hypothetical protein